MRRSYHLKRLVYVDKWQYTTRYKAFIAPYPIIGRLEVNPVPDKVFILRTLSDKVGVGVGLELNNERDIF